MEDTSMRSMVKEIMTAGKKEETLSVRMTRMERLNK
jgi:hypothetical protein